MGVNRTTICENLELDFVEFSEGERAGSLSMTRPVNVAKVRQLSPFRYPGGKTWLVPYVRRWLAGLGFCPKVFVEPFAGGGIIGLTVAVGNLAHKVVMSELDPDVAAVWRTILQNPEGLCRRILEFEVTLENVRKVLAAEAMTEEERAFATIVRNRTQHSGILAPGASLVKSGESGKGLKSRWYPETLVRRIRLINKYHARIEFLEKDGFDVIRQHRGDPRAVFFVDPPYTAGGKKAGKRLYRFNDVNHEELFSLMARTEGAFLMTYDDADEVRQLARSHGFRVDRIPMKNTHHRVMYELLIRKA